MDGLFKKGSITGSILVQATNYTKPLILNGFKVALNVGGINLISSWYQMLKTTGFKHWCPVNQKVMDQVLINFYMFVY